VRHFCQLKKAKNAHLPICTQHKHAELLGVDVPYLSGDDCADFPCANSLQIHRAEVKIATWLPCCANPGQGLFATEDLPQGAYVADSGPFRVLSHVKHTAK
jgi:hypothetical protein